MLEQRLKVLEETVQRLRKPSPTTAEVLDKSNSPQIVIQELPENCSKVHGSFLASDGGSLGSSGEDFYGLFIPLDLSNRLVSKLMP